MQLVGHALGYGLPILAQFCLTFAVAIAVPRDSPYFTSGLSESLLTHINLSEKGGTGGQGTDTNQQFQVLVTQCSLHLCWVSSQHQVSLEGFVRVIKTD